MHRTNYGGVRICYETTRPTCCIEKKTMLTERKKVRLILILFSIVSLIEILLFLFFLYSHSYFGKLLFDIGLTRWGWVLAIVLGIVVITCLIRWKPGKLRLRLFILFFSIIEVIIALLWTYLALVAMSFRA
jgi:hypothetical protein